MKKTILCLGVACAMLSSLSFGQSPDYQVASWFMPSNPLESYVVHDFNDSGVVAGTWIRNNSSGVEEARGIFLWQNGVLRKITPAQGGVPYSRSPAEGASTGIVRISNTRSDGTFFLAAPARQKVPATAFEGAYDLYRVIRYVVKADLKSFPQPVVSATALGGYIFIKFNNQTGWNREFSGGVTDIADDGTVLGYTSDWPYSYPPVLLWRIQGGNSGRYFDLDAAGTLGTPLAMDRNGYIIGAAYDPTPPGLNIIYDAPLSSVTTLSASITRFPTRPGFVELVDGNQKNLRYSIPAIHGPYRAMPSFTGGATAVWSNRFADVSIVQNFNFGTPNYIMPFRKNLSRNGHMLGTINLYPHAALAMRKADGSYSSMLIQNLEPDGMRQKPPFSYSTMGYGANYLTAPLAINSKLDLLCEYTDERGAGFFILKVQPPAPEITVIQGTASNRNLRSDVSKRDFGSIKVGETSKTMLFTIKNIGAAPLKNLDVDLKGYHPGDFNFATTPALTVNPGQSTTFKVRYKPVMVRNSKAILVITSNDSDENPFRVSLTGEGVR